MGIGGETEGGANREIGIDIYIYGLCKTAGWQELTRKHKELSSVLCEDLGGEMQGSRRESKREGICIHVADSVHCTAETNTTL